MNDFVFIDIWKKYRRNVDDIPNYEIESLLKIMFY